MCLLMMVGSGFGVSPGSQSTSATDLFGVVGVLGYEDTDPRGAHNISCILVHYVNMLHYNASLYFIVHKHKYRSFGQMLHIILLSHFLTFFSPSIISCLPTYLPFCTVIPPDNIKWTMQRGNSRTAFSTESCLLFLCYFNHNSTEN